VTAGALAVAGALILLAVRHVDQRQAQEAAVERGRMLVEGVLRESLRAADLRAPVTGARRRALDRLVARTAPDRTIRVTLTGPTGRVTYSSDHRLIGRRSPDAGWLGDVRRGAIVADVTDVATGRGEVKALVTRVPVVLGRGGRPGLASIAQDYAPIAASAREGVLPVAGVLELTVLGLFAFLVPVLAGASRRLGRYVEEIRYRATHDPLTGLANRARLHEAVDEALAGRADDEHVAVLLIDLDRFKEVNDSLGHDAGDELLCELSARFAAAVPAALLARLGGDEFGVVLPATSPSLALAAGAHLRRTLETPFAIREIPVFVDASVGIALAPEHGAETGQLVRRADVAMYLAKRGRSGVALYDPETDLNDAGRLVLMTELRHAIEAEDLEVHYQPIVDVATRQIATVEALVRWRHPIRGLLSPAAFLPLAEHTGLIVELNRLVAREAVAQGAAWRRLGVNLGVSVNMSMLDMLDRSLAHDLLRLVDEHALPPDRFTVEITEDALMQEPERVRRTIERLRQAGIRVAIDDFGTGYSSLSYLRELPVDTVKIDRAFVEGLPEDGPSEAIVRATTQLAERLGLLVVAEGVETEAQLAVLAAAGVDRIQGYLASKPLPGTELTGWITRSLGSVPTAA
jgi:diguanylate cyclase (GGDEF)-like protein